MLPLSAAALVSGKQPARGSAGTTRPVMGPVCASVTGPAPSIEVFTPATEAGEFTVTRDDSLPPGVFAALAIAELATPGAPVMYGKSPSLPAEVATMMPTAAALLVEIADGSAGSPNGEPRLMLITSR